MGYGRGIWLVDCVFGRAGSVQKSMLIGSLGLLRGLLEFDGGVGRRDVR